MNFNVDIKPDNIQHLLRMVDGGQYENLDQAVNDMLHRGIIQHGADVLKERLNKPVEKTVRFLSPGDIAWDIDRLDTGLTDDDLINGVVEKIKHAVISVPVGMEFTAMLLVSRLHPSIQEAVKPNMRARIGMRFSTWAKTQKDIEYSRGRPHPYKRIKK